MESSSPMKHKKLTQWQATAICGNDILSSCLYVSGIAILFAGMYAPLVLLLIGGVLYLYKKVYTEVVEALPVNGGAYNCLLNGTSKMTASIAGVMTLLSYIATAVISAKVGVEYLNIAMEAVGLHLPILGLTIFVLAAFALLVITGVKDSAMVALVIFITHITVLVLFLAFGVFYLSTHGIGHFLENSVATRDVLLSNKTVWEMLYLAFSASLLGVSGFESSANFVEEQAPGVFRKTLRNMLIGVTFFNPLIAVIVLGSMPYDVIIQAKDFLLADAALAIGGTWFQYAVVIDAFLVLCGAVLTSYVGVSGLLHRMSADGCLPSRLTKPNAKGAFPRIVVLFFLLCSSILLLTGGDLLSLAGVYTIAFLGVMTMFALGNLILKEARSYLKRTYRAPILLVALAFFATLFGIFGNIRIDEQNLVFFELYFVPAMLVVLSVIYIDYLLKFLNRFTVWCKPLHKYIAKWLQSVTDRRFVAFIHHPARLQPILDYIKRNETGTHVILVHCKDHDGSKDPKHAREIAEALPHIRAAGFYPDFTIDFLDEDLSFGPSAIHAIVKKLRIARNRIFIGSIHDTHAFDYSDLGGVRIIFG
jgi:amino acid transporter